MKGKYDVITKGNYAETPVDGFVSVRQYLFIKRKGKKYVLFRLSNDRKEILTGVRLAVSQKDVRGKDLGTVYATFPVAVKQNGKFILKEGVEVDPACAEFSVKVDQAVYGEYAYGLRGGELVGVYAPKHEKKDYSAFTGEESVARNTRSRKAPVAIGVIAFLTLALAGAFTFFQLKDFSAKATEFRKNGVVYSFVDGDNSKGSEIVVTEYKGLSKSVRIPESIGGHPVAGIESLAGNTIEKLTVDGDIAFAPTAFSSCKGLEEVHLKKAKTLRNDAFAGKSTLRSFRADNLENIGSFAFYGCSRLKTVTLSHANTETVLTIGKSAFERCASLETFSVSQYLASPETAMFGGISTLKNLSLKNYAYDPLTEVDTSTVTMHGLFGLTSDVDLALETLEIGYIDRLTPAFARNCRSLKSVKIGAAADTTVGDSAFENCGALKTLELPFAPTSVGKCAFWGVALKTFDGSMLTQIADNAFTNCSRLEDVNLDENVVLTSIGKYAFSDCTALKKVDIPLGVTRIEEGTFMNCAKLTACNFAIGNSLAAMDQSAFEGCKALANFSVPVTVETLGQSVFKGCSSLAELTVSYIGGSATENRFMRYLFGAIDPTEESDETKAPKSLKKIILRDGVTALPEYAFAYCEGLEEAVLPLTIESFGKGSFARCVALKNVPWTAGLKRVEEKAFLFCEGLTAVDIPDGVYVGVGAFQGCTGLKSFALNNLDGAYLGYYFGASSGADCLNGCVPEALQSVLVRVMKEIPSYAFAGAGGLLSVLLPEGLEKVGAYAFAGCRSLVTLPALHEAKTLGGYAFMDCAALPALPAIGGVTALPTGVFSGCSSVRTIPAEYARFSEIPAEAFENCSALTEIEAFKDVETLGSGAFRGCTGLRTLPDFSKLNMVSSEVFRGCVGLVELPLWSEVRAIGENAFTGCTGLTSLPAFPALAGIRASAFAECTGLTAVSALPKLVEIGERAFQGCTALTSVELSPIVEYVGYAAFQGCNAIETYTAPFVGAMRYTGYANESYLGYVFGEGGYYNQGVVVPQTLHTVTVSDSDIAEYAFFDCAYLKTVVLENTERIGNEAFYHCTSLHTVYLPKMLTEIGWNAFGECRKLYELYNESALPLVRGGEDYGRVSYWALAVHGSFMDMAATSATEQGYTYLQGDDGWFITGVPENTTELRFPTNVLTPTGTVNTFGLPNEIFYQNYNINTVSLPNVFCLGDRAFAYCGNLTSLTFGENSWFASIERAHFEGCYALTSLALPVGLSKIGDMAFQDFTSLQTVTLPDSSELTTIGGSAFQNCPSLHEIFLPKNVRTIGDYAFYNCSGLQKVRYASVTWATANATIGQYAFAECWNLQSMTIPASMQTIGECAFLGDTQLYEVYNLSRLGIVLGDDGFGGVAKYAVSVLTNANAQGVVTAQQDGVTYKLGQRSAIVSYDGYAQNLEFKPVTAEGVTEEHFEIRPYVFAYRPELEGVSCNGVISKVGESAFSDCSNLKTVIFNGGVTEIGDRAFYHCSSLSSVDFESAPIEKIGMEAFFYCTSLQKANFAKGLKSVGVSAFNSCSKLREVTLPITLQTIEDMAFYGCSRLYQVYNLAGLPISVGSYNCGYVARYALKVSEKLTDGMVFVDGDTFNFYRLDGVWVLYEYLGNQNEYILYLPESFVYDGKEVTAYKIADYAINGYYSGVYIPKAVKGIASRAFSNCYYLTVVYFMGDLDGWNAVDGATTANRIRNAEKLWYRDCLHDYGYWTWADGQITTEQMPEDMLTWKTVTPATCLAEGKEEGVCPNEGCGYTVTRTLSKLPHDFDTDGKCKTEGCKATKVPIEKTDLILTNFQEKGGVYESTVQNKSSGRASLTYKAKSTVIVRFDYTVSSEFDCDFMRIYVGGVEVFSTSGEDSSSFEVELQAGQELVIVYAKDGSVDGGTDKVTISNLTVIKETSDGTNFY